MERLRAVIYIRVSDPSQIENNSLGTQLKACKSFAEASNLEVVEVFREEGFSAKHIHTRPEMRRMLKFCTSKKNNISRIIVYKMDRWTRNVEEGLAAMTVLAKFGVAVIPATETAEQSPMGKAMRTILMAFGELDNSIKSERVRDNMQTMFREGTWCWKCPVGYMRLGDSRDERRGQPVILNKPFARIIKLLFEKASTGYYTKKQLADYLNSLGFKDFYGKEATGKKVGEILGNTFYYGEMYAKKWNEYHWGKHEKLVDKEIWEKAYYNTLGKKRMYRHQDNNLFPLKGILKCATCNHPMTSSNPKGRSENYLCYECHQESCIHHERVGTEEATKQFLSVLSSLKPSKRVLKLFTSMVFNEWDKTIEITKHEAKLKDEEIARLDRKLTSIAESNSKGILTDEEARKRAEEIRQELTVLKVERSDIRIEQYDTETVKSFTENFLGSFDRLWAELDLTQKQALQTQIFPNGIVCEKKEIRTTTLSQSFEMIEALKANNFNSVTPLEFESKFSE